MYLYIVWTSEEVMNDKGNEEVQDVDKDIKSNLRKVLVENYF